MSVTNTKAKSVYNANGTTTEWNLGFTYDDTVSNVHIYIVDANDNETEVTSNYSIADGVLTYPTTASGLDPLAEGNKLVIVRDTPRTQDIELTSNGKLDGKVLEGGYDKLTLQVQELTEQVNRAVKIPVTEESADNFLDPITAITEAKKEALVEIAQATEPAEAAKDTAVAKAQVATEQATIATNAATSAKAAQVGAKTAEQNATAQAEKAENAVTAFVEGLGTAKNAVIDLGTFDGKTGVTSSRIIEFDKKPIAVSLRFSDTNKKLWLNGTNSTVGIEVVDNTHCNIFYSIASADFVGQNAVKGPFVVQAVIQYTWLDVAATETELGAVQLATKAEAEAGTNDTKAMTPLKTKYAIEANATVKTLRNDVDDLGDQVAAIEGKIPAEATTANQLADKEFVTTITDELAADITALDADVQNINLIKWVQVLPATGETKYLYAIPRNEVDKDGKKIVALYLWDGTEWRGAGGTSIDPGISEGDGIKGDYCTTYGIIDAPNGILTNPSGMEVVLKQGVVLQLAGQDIKTTISGDLTHTITSTADCDLFYVSGTTSLMEVAEIVWSRIEPDNGQAGVLAWWNPDNKKWKFKSNDTGNVWAEAVATPIAHIHTNGTTITRIDHIGYRILDDEVYALKSEVTNLPLLSFQWFEHLLEDMSWLRADTFSWHSGDKYTAAYNKLVEEYNNSTQEIVIDRHLNTDVANIVGDSVTIDNNLVASNFSDNSYIEMPGISEPTKSWAFYFDTTFGVFVGGSANFRTICCFEHSWTRPSDGNVVTAKSCVNVKEQIQVSFGVPISANKLFTVANKMQATDPVTVYVEHYYDENASNGNPYKFTVTVRKKETAETVVSFSTDTRQVLSSISKIILGNNPSVSGSAYTYNDNGSIDLKSYRYAQYKEGANGHPFNEDFSENTSYNWNGCCVSKSYMRSPNGFNIVPASEHDVVEQEYTAKGIAWYYILDTLNKRFKLPRTKFGFTGLRTGVGNYVAPGLPNLDSDTNWVNVTSGTETTATNTNNLSDKGVFGGTNSQGGHGIDGNKYPINWRRFDASKSNAIYGASNTVQPPATEMYLYFYVGNYTQKAIEQTARLNAEMFNGKADTDLANVASNIDYVVESKVPTESDPSWYEVWKSGKLRQGGTKTTSGELGTQYTFFKPFANASYTFIATPFYTFDRTLVITEKTATTFKVAYSSSGSGRYDWIAEGQGA